MIQCISSKELGPKLKADIEKVESICLTTHINPDGDGLCTCLALQRIIQGMGKRADIVTDDESLERFSYLQAADKVIVSHDSLQYDLVIVIDLHDYQRLGSRRHLAEKAKQTVVIDHHEIEDDMMDCAYCWIDSGAVCTGWMLHELFQQEIAAMQDDEQRYIGECLYTTLLNDTNNFTNANTDRHAYELAAAITRYKVKPYIIQRRFMDTRTPQEMRLIGQIISTIEMHNNGKVLFMTSTLAMLDENGLEAEATSNMTRWVQDLKGVETVVYFREEYQDNYRLSLRSKSINVHSIAVKFGGGGHIQASGCNCQGSIDQLKAGILMEIQNAEKL